MAPSATISRQTSRSTGSARIERRVEVKTATLAAATPCSCSTSSASTAHVPGRQRVQRDRRAAAPLRRSHARSTRSSTAAMCPDEIPISPIRPQARRRGRRAESATSSAASSDDARRGDARRHDLGDVVATTGHHVQAAGAREPNERGMVAAELGRLVDHRAAAGRGEQESSAAICRGRRAGGCRDRRAAGVARGQGCRGRPARRSATLGGHRAGPACKTGSRCADEVFVRQAEAQRRGRDRTEHVTILPVACADSTADQPLRPPTGKRRAARSRSRQANPARRATSMGSPSL